MSYIVIICYIILHYCRLPNDEVEASIINKILHCRQAAIGEKEKEIECIIEEKKTIGEEKDRINKEKDRIKNENDLFKKENKRISEQHKALISSYDTVLQQLSC